MDPDLYYCIAAYNEEDHIENCIDSLANQTFDGNLETIICVNGCSDGTEQKIQEAKEQYDDLNIQIIQSDKGIALAQNAITNHVSRRDAPLLFVDADVVLDADCTRILYDDMKDNSSLIVAGAWPVPQKSDSMTGWESLLFKVLHVRAHHPEAEISVNDVSDFKSFVDEHPQPTITPEFEKKSKIYFHGRAFMVKNADSYNIPPQSDVCDDTFMPNKIHVEYGPGTIRTRYDAQVFYTPYKTLREHFKIYRRIFLDLRHIDQTMDDFKEIRDMEKTKLDWQYILKQGFPTIAEFLLYKSITGSEELCYRILPKKGLADMWVYKKK